VRHERATEEIRELAALYALGSLTQQEARSFEIHMQEPCPVCEAECRRYERIVACIGFASEEADPPAYIRDLILARLDREPRDAAAKAMHEASGSTLSPSPGFQSILFQNPDKKKKPAVPIWIFVAVSAAVLAAVLAAYAWKSEQERNRQLQAEIKEAEAYTADLRTELEDQKDKAGQLERIPTLAGKPMLRIARLEAQSGTYLSLGAVLWDKELDQCMFLGTLPPAPEGKIYQLWFVTPTAKLPAGAIQTGSTGSTFASVPVPENAVDSLLVLLTLEPDNDVQIPSTPYFAVGSFN
jgi:anti-sigma-K factor RskA